jgi:hypothetical protein
VCVCCACVFVCVLRSFVFPRSSARISELPLYSTSSLMSLLLVVLRRYRLRPRRRRRCRLPPLWASSSPSSSCSFRRERSWTVLRIICRRSTSSSLLVVVVVVCRRRLGRPRDISRVSQLVPPSLRRPWVGPATQVALTSRCLSPFAFVVFACRTSLGSRPFVRASSSSCLCRCTLSLGRLSLQRAH